MTPSATLAAPLAPEQELQVGEVLFEAGGMGPVWQLQTGALRLDRVSREGPRFMQLVLPGDLLGLELLAAYPYAYTARALVPSRAVARQPVTEAERRLILVEGLAQQQRRIEDLVALRTGPAQDRLKHLLLLLVPADMPWSGTVAELALPTLKDMAAILDTAPETVSRIFANLRRTQILDTRQRQSASFSLARLREVEWPTGMTRSDGLLRQPQAPEAA
ncbi:Crp/Fnr family transcriptional regulator [Ideonella livida]|uniref:Crp/Fnr family transcriptional regulator n=1 Tax=Ideonella livida TaxID=2707176 RepID=A0A7C9TKZ1_9BURK|nr:Crp/Fnr family transcriptional regulator [Ideonella livida]NDY91923.1 Crp/Fnr family transcriptional regulator [Ideonella livida]